VADCNGQGAPLVPLLEVALDRVRAASAQAGAHGANGGALAGGDQCVGRRSGLLVGDALAARGGLLRFHRILRNGMIRYVIYDMRRMQAAHAEDGQNGYRDAAPSRRALRRQERRDDELLALHREAILARIQKGETPSAIVGWLHQFGYVGTPANYTFGNEVRWARLGMANSLGSGSAGACGVSENAPRRRATRWPHSEVTARLV